MIFDLYLTDEQRLIADSLEVFFSETLPTSRLRSPSSHGARAERAAWPAIAGSGLFGIGIGDSDAGDGICEQVLAARALGKFCISPTILATMIAARIAHDADQEELSEAFSTGASRACFANPLNGDGEAHLIDSDDCEWVVVLAPSPVLVARTRCEDVRPVISIDDTLDFKRVRLRSAKEQRADFDARVSLLTAAYLVGNAQTTLGMAVEYVSSREQFGQPIGAFQAIKHGCADMAVRASAAESQTFYAALSHATLPSGASADVAAARLLSRAAAVGNAKANIQYHGAMGFTAECDAHLYLKRALLFGALGSNLRQDEIQILALPRA